jgi:hypothetical protein
MKSWRWLVLVPWLFVAASAHAAGYTVSSTAVSSTTTPVAVLSPGAATTTWQLCNRAAATAPVLCFPYKGTLPGSAPAGAVEIPASSCRGDGTVYDTVILQSGWACVMEASGSTTVDAMSR